MRTLFSSLLLLTLTACSSTQESHIQAKQLLNQINNQTAPLIIDVRSDAEYQSGHIQSARHIPFWQSFSADLPDNVNNKPLILYCEHGPRAGIAKFAYYLSGFNDIRYLEGHMSAWRTAKLPMAR